MNKSSWLLIYGGDYGHAGFGVYHRRIHRVYFVLKNPVLWAGSEVIGFACKMPIC